MAQVIKRGKKKYLVRVFIGRKSPGVSPYLDKIIHGTKKNALNYASETETKRDMGVLDQPQPSDPLVSDYLKEWFQAFKEGTVRERTATSYRDVINLYLVPHLGGCHLSELTARTIQDAYNNLAARHSPRTVSYAHSLLREALDHATREGVISANPALSTRRPPRKKPKIDALSPEQADRFIKAAQADRHGVLFWLAIATGLRPEEYLALTWPDVDIDHCILTVHRTVYFPEGGGWRFEDVKTESSARTVEFNARLARALAEHKRRQAEQRLRAGQKYRNSDLVFAGRNGSTLNMRNLTVRHLKPVLEAAGVDGKANLYRLRHSFVTLSLLAGVDQKTVSEAAGHASVAFTLDTYAHVLPAMRTEAARKIGDMLFKSV